MVEKTWIKELDKANAQRVEPTYKDVEINCTIRFTVPSSNLQQKDNQKYLIELATKLLGLSAEDRHKAKWKDDTPIFERLELDNRATIYKYS